MSKNSLNLTKDPISVLFVKIAIPSSVGTVFMTLYNLVDTYFAGKISPEALAALAQTFPVYFIIPLNIIILNYKLITFLQKG